MRTHLSNAAYGVLDYVAYPAAMLVAAPTLLHHLGTAQYGIWIVCTAAVSTGGIIASGFGDAHIQYVAAQRAHGNGRAVERAVRSMIGINLLLGLLMAGLGLATAQILARHVVGRDAAMYETCVWSLRTASLVTLVRAIESVCICTQRAFERYGAAVRISIATRVLTIAVAAAIVTAGYDLTGIMAWTLALTTAGTVVQLVSLRSLVGAAPLWPAFDRDACRALFGFGVFSWLQAVSSVIFGQADRLMLGAALGAASVTSYALCVQIAQPIYGIAAAGLHFLFPYLAGLQEGTQGVRVRKAIGAALSANVLFVLVVTAGELLFGHALLHAWVGEEIAQASRGLLAPVALSFALPGLGVTGYYALLASGRVRIVTGLNLAGGAAMLLLMAWLLPRTGVQGVATARLVYGGVTLGMYLPLIGTIFSARSRISAAADACLMTEAGGLTGQRLVLAPKEAHHEVLP